MSNKIELSDNTAEEFEKAIESIRKAYGSSPDLEDLVNFILSDQDSIRIASAWTEAVLNSAGYVVDYGGESPLGRDDDLEDFATADLSQ